MNKYDQKYGTKDDEKTAKFHKSRRMFCIKNNKLYTAKAKLSYSHAVWFEKEGWISASNDRFMKENVRGVVFKDGEIRFSVLATWYHRTG